MKTEHVILAIAALALAALFFYHKSGAPVVMVDNSQDPQNKAAFATGPAWLVYNQPWGFNPAVGNVMPSTSMGQVGAVQPAGSFQNFSSDCGCGG